MSNSLEFSINAKDNTSKVVDTVTKKINSFGTDLAKMALGVAGPMALVQMGIGAIGTAIEDYKQKIAEAIKFGAELPNQAKALNISVEEYQRLGNAAQAAGLGVDQVANAYAEVRKAIEAAKDPTSSQAAALEALGFAAADIAAGAVKPIEVIERLGRAMATGADDATQFKIASALLGGSVEKLIPILLKAKEASQGYTDAGDVLTEDEAAILRESEAVKRQVEMKDKVAKARNEARDLARRGGGAATSGKFLEAKRALGFEMTTDQASQRFGDIGTVAGSSAMAAAGFGVRVDEKGERTVRKLDLTDEEADLVIKEYVAREKARKAAEEASKAAAAKEAAAKLQGIADEAAAKKAKEAADAKATTDGAKEKKKKDDDAAKAAADKDKKDKADLAKSLDAEKKATEVDRFTGSSLRDIGGALAGEAMTSGIDYAAASLDIEQKILIELQKMNTKTLPEVPSTNFTKPSSMAGGTYTV
jgi:hypothetical protein